MERYQIPTPTPAPYYASCMGHLAHCLTYFCPSNLHQGFKNLLQSFRDFIAIFWEVHRVTLNKWANTPNLCWPFSGLINWHCIYEALANKTPIKKRSNQRISDIGKLRSILVKHFVWQYKTKSYTPQSLSPQKGGYVSRNVALEMCLFLFGAIITYFWEIRIWLLAG